MDTAIIAAYTYDKTFVHVQSGAVMTLMRMRCERERAGMSRAALARVAEMHPATVGQIESGRLRPYPSQLAKVAAALGWEGEPEGLLEEIAGGGSR